MRPRLRSGSGLAAAAVPLALVPALGAVQGGFLPDSWVWATPLAAWGAALGALLGGAALRRGGAWAAAALGVTIWTAASTLWSASDSQSWLEARRAALYAAVVLALLALARRGSATALVHATHAGISLLLAYALARYLLGPRRIDEFEGSHLAHPLGYANAVGILAVLGLLLGLGIAARTGSTAGRTALASLPPLALALSLTGSRGSWGALAAGGLVLLALEPPARVLRVAAAGLPGALALAVLAAELRLPDSHASPSATARALVALAALAAAAATGAAGPWAAAGDPERRPRLTPALLVAALAAGVTVVVLAARSEPRASYWHVAWSRQVTAHPALGTGAGTFGRSWVDSGLAPSRGGALDAHSLYVETLAELGPVGLLLVAAFLLLPLRRIVRPPGGVVPAAAAAYAAFLVHAGLDWDWELPAVVVAGLACAAALVLGDGDGEPEPEPSASLRAAAIAAALVLGGAGIAGAGSDTVPAATSGNGKAPPGGAFRELRRPGPAQGSS